MRLPVISIVVMTAYGFASADPTVTVTLESSVEGQSVAPGAAIDWTIKLQVSGGDNAGLALVSADLVQNASNPDFTDLLPAVAVPGEMSEFSRPAGISNPGEGGTASGYIGVQRSPTGEVYKNLVQIGGGQNTFGVAGGGGIGQDVNAHAGIGQSGTPVTIASGTFNAPSAAGTYSFQLDNVIANVLAPVVPAPVPPAFWPTTRATVDLSGASFTVVVSSVLRGDLNCDNVVNIDDVSHFVLAMVDSEEYEATHPTCDINRADMNTSGAVDSADIQGFVASLLQ